MSITIQETITQLEQKYKDRLVVNPDLNRKLVSFQANKAEPIYRWFKYREGFSRPLIDYIINNANIKKSSHILDPFAGTGASCFAACSLGHQATGLELLPVGIEFIKTRKILGNIYFKQIVNFVQEEITNNKTWKNTKDIVPFNHIRITQGAFSKEQEKELGKYRAWTETLKEPFKSIANLISYSILEEISFTRKDGQYLRWDHRAPKKGLRSKFDKGVILSFEEAIEKKCLQIIQDLSDQLNGKFDTKGVNSPVIFEGQNFITINKIPDESVDLVITSPPYCNRYDYTRTYALELAYLNYGEDDVKALRQAMLTCTVENRPKDLEKTVSEKVLIEAIEAFNECSALQNILQYLHEQKTLKKLNNPGIYSMVRGYFLEMAVHIRQISDKLKRGAKYYMVNDNVKYAGLDIPVDCILSELAEKLGLHCEKIWVLPKGKGNSSQQMKKHGKTELRKCIYIWIKL